MLKQIQLHSFFFSYSSLLFIIPGNQKLAALGIRVAHWITYHGLAPQITVLIFIHIVRDTHYLIVT